MGENQRLPGTVIRTPITDLISMATDPTTSEQAMAATTQAAMPMEAAMATAGLAATADRVGMAGVETVGAGMVAADAAEEVVAAGADAAAARTCSIAKC